MKHYDVVVIGGGMAGLSAALYAAADGMRVVVVEKESHFGGQAFHSPRIENVVGLATRGAWVSGPTLADISARQAEDMGVEFVEEDEVVNILPAPPTFAQAGLWISHLRSGFTLESPIVLFATGARFRTLSNPNLLPHVGSKLFYGGPWQGPYIDPSFSVAVVGGGNAAAQVVIHLAKAHRQVHVVVRGVPTWSKYLDNRIEDASNITIHVESELVDIGDRTMTLRRRKTERFTIPARYAFALIGTVPNIELAQKIDLRLAPYNSDRIMVGEAAVDGALPLETSKPGIFAVGDVRDGMGHGIAAAMGDGNVAVGSFWSYLREKFPSTEEALHPAVRWTSQHLVDLFPASAETPTELPQF